MPHVKCARFSDARSVEALFFSPDARGTHVPLVQRVDYWRAHMPELTEFPILLRPPRDAAYYIVALPKTLTSLDAPHCVLSFCHNVQPGTFYYAPGYPIACDRLMPQPDGDRRRPLTLSQKVISRARQAVAQLRTLRIASVSPLRAFCQIDTLPLLDRLEVSHFVARRLVDSPAL